MAETQGEIEKKYTFGLSKNLACMLAYFLGWVSGLIFWLAEKEDKEIRFCAAQSIVVFGFLTVLWLLTLGLLGPVIFLAEFVLWLILVVKSYQGEMMRLPVAAELADKLVTKSI